MTETRHIADPVDEISVRRLSLSAPPDPSTVEMVDLKTLPPGLGRSVRYVGTTIEATDAPVTRGIAALVPSIPRYRGLSDAVKKAMLPNWLDIRSDTALQRND